MRIPVSVIIFISAFLFISFVLWNSLYSLHETEQAIITQFGAPTGAPVKEAGLHLKVPIIQKVNRLEKRILEWDGKPNQIPTKDKLFIIVDTYARWRISDPLLYFQRLRDERGAQSRLDDILDGETRNAIAQHELIEIIRSTKDRVPSADATLEGAREVGKLGAISVGRHAIVSSILENASRRVEALGIEILDVQFKRINYNEDVQSKIYERMISEREQIADKFRSEGQGEAARILGEKERELLRIESEAYKQIQGIKGKADARATEIYTSAFNQSEEAYEFYEFIETMETYRTTLDKDTTVILSTNSEFLKFLNSIEVDEAGP